MKRVRCVLVAVAGLVLGAPQASAGLQGSPNIAQLAAAADIIVIATVVDDVVVLGGAQGVTFTLLVDRVLKGPEQANMSLPVVWVPMTGGPLGDAKYIRGAHGVFFVRRARTGEFQIVPHAGSNERFEDTIFPVASGPLDAKYAYAPAASVVEKLFLELGAAVASPSLQNALLNFLHWTPLDSSLNSVAHRVYENWAASSDGKVRMFGLAGLVRQGDGVALQKAAQTLQDLGNSTPQPWVLSLAISGYFRSGSPADLKTLARLTNAGPIDVRRAAAYALAAVHSRDSLPFLANLLESDDPDIRSYGVGGLAMFANHVATITITSYPGAGMQPQSGDAPYRTQETMKHFTMGSETMRSNEAYYVIFWKDWWKQHAGQLAK